MTASAFLLQVNTSTPYSSIREGHNAVVVFAEDENGAREAAASYFEGDSDIIWLDDSLSTATAIITDPNLWGNFAINVIVANLAAEESIREIVNVTVLGADLANTDTFFTAVATALNATTPIANASWDSENAVLTVAGAADNLGHRTIVAKIYRKADPSKTSIPHLLGDITDEGVSGAALTIAIPAVSLPKVYAAVKA